MKMVLGAGVIAIAICHYADVNNKFLHDYDEST